MQVAVHIVNPFTDALGGGSPAGVVLDAGALTAVQKLAIARQVGPSETAFVSASQTATATSCWPATGPSWNRPVRPEPASTSQRIRASGSHRPRASRQDWGLAGSTHLWSARTTPFCRLRPAGRARPGRPPSPAGPGAGHQQRAGPDRCLCVHHENATTGPQACLLRGVMGVLDRELPIEQGWLMQPPSPSLIRVVLERGHGRITRLMVGGASHIIRTMVLET